MDLKSTIFFLQRLYDNAGEHNLSRLEHEALRQAVTTLTSVLDKENVDLKKSKETSHE